MNWKKCLYEDNVNANAFLNPMQAVMEYGRLAKVKNLNATALHGHRELCMSKLFSGNHEGLAYRRRNVCFSFASII